MKVVKSAPAVGFYIIFPGEFWAGWTNPVSRLEQPVFTFPRADYSTFIAQVYILFFLWPSFSMKVYLVSFASLTYLFCLRDGCFTVFSIIQKLWNCFSKDFCCIFTGLGKYPNLWDSTDFELSSNFQTLWGHGDFLFLDTVKKKESRVLYAVAHLKPSASSA